MGFGASSAYGGPCRMPTAERLASGGLSYSRFHTTAICAPTRVSLLSGRNHHSAGMGTVPEMGTSSPGYDCIRPRLDGDAAAHPVGQRLPDRCVREDAPDPDVGGRRDRPVRPLAAERGLRPLLRLPGGRDQPVHPRARRRRHPDRPPADPGGGLPPVRGPRRPGGHLDRDVNSLEPDRPWFTYLSYGACHDPLQVPESWRGRTAASSPTAGTSSASAPSRARRSWGWCRPTPSSRLSTDVPAGGRSATTSGRCRSG